MRCGEDATDCALKHVVPALDGRCTKTRTTGHERIPYEWAARCPCCAAERKMTLTVSGARLLHFCHRCHASQEALRAALAQILPQCFGGRARRQVGTEDLVTLAARDLPLTAKNVALLRMAGISAAEARRILKIPKSSYYRALSELAGESQKWDRAAGQ
jgi:hypothetical protein